MPRAAARRRSLAERVEAVFEAWGYARIITPVFEVADVLERGLGAGARAAAIRFVEPGTGEIVALRPDITPQIARVVATRLAEIEGPIRLCYEGAVTRLAGEAGQREVLQAGIELIDAREPEGDAEVLAVAASALRAAELPEIRIDVGHVAPARYVLGAVPDDDARQLLAATLARKDRRALRRAASVLPPAIAELAEALVSLWGPAPTVLARARAQAWPADVRDGLDRLERTITRFAELVEPPAPEVTIDLGDVRGFDYYSGVRFAGYAAGAPDAVLRGGRYDELIGRYGRAARATGFAVDLEALAQAQRAAGLAPPSGSVGVAVVGEAAPTYARALRAVGCRAVTADHVPSASWLRGAGLDAAVALDARELIRADGRRTPLDTAEPRALVKLLEEDRCLS